SFVRLPDNNQVQTSPGSVELWFKMPSGNTAGGVLFDQQNTSLPTMTQASGSYVPALYVGTDGKLHGKFYDTDLSGTNLASAAKVNDGRWHHAVLAAATNAQTLYLDGVAQGSTSAALKASAAGFTYVGAGAAGGSWPNHPTNTLGWFPGSIA